MPDLDISLQPKQLQAFEHVEAGKSPYLFYGGAKGGGKSYLIRSKELIRRMKYAGTTGCIIRKTYPELLANHIRKFFTEYPFLKDWYKASEKAIYYPNGSVTDFRYLASTDDVYGYQGIEYDDITIDEITQHEEEVFKILKTSLRLDPKVLEKNPDFKPSFLLTGNPGGIGHGWVKRLFVDRKFNPEENPAKYDFIQAKVFDNQIFIDVNPEYLQNLEDLPSDLRRAYLDGDWDIFIGQFFTDFRRFIHVVEPFTPPSDWVKIIGIDWGFSSHPFHVGWYTKDFHGNIYKYREYTGLETSPEDVAKRVIEYSSEDRNIQFVVGDTNMWELNPFSKPRPGELYSDKSIAAQMNEIFKSRNLLMYQANKARITGWTYLKTLMQWKGTRLSDGSMNITQKPKFFMFANCESTIAAYPNQIFSEIKPEDMQKMDGDDPCDTDRYAILAIRDGVKKEEKQKTVIQKRREQILSKNKQHRSTVY